MRNYYHKGDTCTFVAPYAVASGAGFLVGALFAVAACDAAQAASVEGDVVGVFTLAKAAGVNWVAGAKLYWDDANKVVTNVAAAHVLIGAALKDAVNADATCLVRLNGVTVA